MIPERSTSQASPPWRRRDSGRTFRPTLLASLTLLLACAAGCSCTGQPTSVASAALTECSACHGRAGDSAPPTSAHGATSSSNRGVGAHQTHLNPGPFRKAVACSECHPVPTRVTSPGHIDGVAEVVFGGLAVARGTAPRYDPASATCSNVYCHGGTLAGGTNTAPVWTRVDGSQVACGTCHGLPPPPASGHPVVTGTGTATCNACHPGTVKADGTIDIAGGQHIDGVVELGAAACASCHGDAKRLPAQIASAPPRDSLGNTAITARGVGAHQRHLAGGTLAPPIACTECHLVPQNLLAHPDGTIDMTWGPLASAAGAVPAWNGTSCSASYCHGGTLKGGTATAPIWTRVDGTQVTCTSCHGLPPPTAAHSGLAAGVNCGNCHAGYTASTVNLALHIDGYVEINGQTCASCHGDASRPPAISAAPPTDVSGNTSTAALGVGAHMTHLTGTTLRPPVACTECHPAVKSVTHAQGQNFQVKMEWGPLASAGGSFPVWDRSTATCSSTYCHGSTLTGGTNTTPVWTKVDGKQAACGTCHGNPPPEPHEQRSDCGSCHPGFTSQAVNLAIHMNGVIDAELGCASCHGDPVRAIAAIQPAPPADTQGNSAPSARGVGAHQKHLTDSALRRAIACNECHVVPTVTNHSNGTVDMDWGPLAQTGGTAPTWNGTTCANYCHGATLAGGTNKAPVWTRVDGTQAACGTCHGVPPPPPHVQDQNCGGCHSGYTATQVNLSRHMNGVIDAAANCTSCHGDATKPSAIASAPPQDSQGNTATTFITVGAHQAHLNAGPLAPAMDCTECHVVPPDLTNHPNGILNMTFGPLASTGTAAPVWSVSTATCSATYCHGATLLGGTNKTPVWTRVDGTQAACGTCHAIPTPTPAHTGVTATTNCGTCHPGYTATTVNTALHVNGVTDANGASCTSCHGNASRPAAIASAPPVDAFPAHNTATTFVSVGAHQAHLNANALRAAVACTECHRVPPDLTNHPNPASTTTSHVVDMTWGPLARAQGAAPVWSASTATCSATYCHGATLTGGSNTRPIWTKVDGTQAACGTCHGAPPPPPHSTSTACGSCHAGYTATTVNRTTHMDGVIQATAQTCSSCHGDPARALVPGADTQAKAAPPADTKGGTATSLITVGVHLAHLNPGSGAIAGPVACSECHVVPTSVNHSNGRVEVSFGPRARTGGANPTFNATTATCSNVYCHGAYAGGTNSTPSWTAAGSLTCTTCHAMPPATAHHRPAFSHDGGNACNVCHKDTDSTGSRITNPSLHMNGVVNGLCHECHRNLTP